MRRKKQQQTRKRFASIHFPISPTSLTPKGNHFPRKFKLFDLLFTPSYGCIIIIFFSACTNLCRDLVSSSCLLPVKSSSLTSAASSNVKPMNDPLSPGTSNCSWTSCREGCTKELYDCTQIRVNYKLPTNTSEDSDGQGEGGGAVGGVEDDEDSTTMGKPRYDRSLREYDYVEDLDEDFAEDDEAGLPKPFPTGIEQVCSNGVFNYTSQIIL